MQRCQACGIKTANRGMVVSIPLQVLHFYVEGELRKTYMISSSALPPSTKRHSLGTPPGLHVIAEKIGGESPPGIVFKGRATTGRHFSEPGPFDPADNLITSRILWLAGAEPGINQGDDVDTYRRYIYIHGTNHEDRLGQPSSGGCIHMGNLDIVELYEEVRTGDPVWILQEKTELTENL